MEQVWGRYMAHMGRCGQDGAGVGNMCGAGVGLVRSRCGAGEAGVGNMCGAGVDRYGQVRGRYGAGTGRCESGVGHGQEGVPSVGVPFCLEEGEVHGRSGEKAVVLAWRGCSQPGQ